jgi:hypothetical protein
MEDLLNELLDCFLTRRLLKILLEFLGVLNVELKHRHVHTYCEATWTAISLTEDTIASITTV